LPGKSKKIWSCRFRLPAADYPVLSGVHAAGAGPAGRRTGGTVKYLCLIYDEEKKMGTMSKSEGEAFMGEYFAFTEAIKKSGHYVAGEALQPVQTATSVRIRNGKASTTDGPFAETKEQLGGFYMVTANDLNEAIQIASRIPSAKTGTVEVRPVHEFS
jgi:hypothetical protein